MKVSAVLQVGLRVLAIYLFVGSVQLINALLIFLFGLNGRSAFASPEGLLLMVGILIQLLIAFTIFVKAERVAKILLPQRSDSATEIFNDLKSLQVSIFQIFGVLFVVKSIPDLFHNIAWLLVMKNAVESRITILTTLIEMTVGAILCSKANKISDNLRICSREETRPKI